MAYKTLLSVLTDTASVNPILAAAAALARREDAHLDVLSLGIDRSQVGYSYIGGAIALAQISIGQAEAEARALDQAARKALGMEDLRWSAEGAIAQLGGLGTLVALKARFSDLVVLQQPYGAGRGVEAEAVLEAALFEGQAPVLVLPDTGLPKTGFARITVGWNQSREALAAVRRALPLLKQAEIVNIAVVDPSQYGPERSDPGGLLCQMLVRHGVKAEVSVLAKTLPRVSEVLSRHVRDQNADLLVLGAYSHSRLREAILGGATRDLLEHSDVPVFLAH